MASHRKSVIPSPATFFAWLKVVMALYSIPSEQVTYAQSAQRNKMYELLLTDCLSPSAILTGLTRLRVIGTLKMLDATKFDLISSDVETKRLAEQKLIIESPSPLDS